MADHRFYEFGRFRLDARGRVLFCGGQSVPLAPKVADTLLVLVENAGNVVDKEVLLKRVWPDSFVEEGSLTRTISVLRKTLGNGIEGEYVATVPKRGYRFSAQVNVLDSAPAVLLPAAPSSEAPAQSSAQAKPAGSFRWIVLAAVFVILMAAFLLWRRSSVNGVAQRPMLAVLPVENLTGDPEREYLGDGLTEELIAQLGSLDPDRLGVIARTSSMTYKASGKTLPQIAQELGVDYVLEGSIRGRTESVRVTTQLIRARDQSHLWAQSYDRDLADMVRMEKDIAEEVARSIQLRLPYATHMRLTDNIPGNPNVYQLYLKGRFYWNTRTPDGLLRSIDYYQQALQLDPVNARAYAGLADSYNMLGFYGYAHTTEDLNRGTAAARKAMELDTNLADAHAALAYAKFYWAWEFPEAEGEFLRAIQLDGNYLPAHHWYALFLAAMGRQPESLDQIQLAEKLDPFSPSVHAGAGFVDYFARQYDDAIRECNTALNLNPKSLAALQVRGQAYEAKHDFDKAIADLQSALDLAGNRAFISLGPLGHAYAMAGRRQDAEAILSELDQRSQHEYVGGYNQALVWAGLGDKQKTVAALQRAVKANDAGMIWLPVDPRFDSVRSDPEVSGLLPRSGR